MSASSGRKGAAGERELVRFLRARGFDVTRNLDQPRDGGSDVAGFDRFCVEVKRCERVRIWEALEQAAAAAKDGQAPLVCFRRDRGGWMAALPLEEPLALLRRGVTPAGAADAVRTPHRGEAGAEDGSA
jgi:Holliday junction resolvase